MFAEAGSDGKYVGAPVSMKKIRVVVPCYNEEEVLPEFLNAIVSRADSMEDHTFEFVFVDDGSKDATQEVLLSF